MEPRAAPRTVVVLGVDARAVGRTVVELRAGGLVPAAFVGEDHDLARHMAVEMLGGADELLSADERDAPLP